jgi:polysaccharide export outer membrane protein
VQVNAMGEISLPLVGLVPAAGLTPSQLSDNLRDRLDARYLNHANVTVTVKEAQSQKVTVDGAVVEPGIYALGGGATLMQAVAMAKGLDGANANAHKVTVFRNVDSKWTSTPYDLAAIRNGKAADPVLQGRDVIVVATSRKQAVLRDLGNILPFALLVGAL